jgi:tRNA-specific 2-thiouridylase
MKQKVLMAMSGGVDSTTAALLLKENGYDVIGVTLKMFDSKDIGLGAEGDSSVSNAADAKSAAEKFGFPHYVFDFCDCFRKHVIDHFIAEYESGRTPNPCVDCNKHVKLGHLFAKAEELGCDCIATGHYANVKFNEETGRWLLLRGEDRQKDQSYMLYTLTQKQLAHILFPLGHLHKTQIRERAEAEGLQNARKPDSQDICFVPDGDYARVIRNITKRAPRPGKFIHLDGTVLGTHKGQLHYTIGQRKGLGIAYRYPLYVVKKDVEKNIVYLGPQEALFSSTLIAENCNLISVPELTGPLRVTAKPRYRAKDVPAVIEPMADGNIKVIFDEPQRALTPGQAVVFYQDDAVVGGGTIK